MEVEVLDFLSETLDSFQIFLFPLFKLFEILFNLQNSSFNTKSKRSQ